METTMPKTLAPFPVRAAVAAAVLAALAAPPAVAASYVWSAGAFVPGTTAPSPLPAGDLLTIQGSSSKSFNAVAFANEGSVNQLASVSLLNGAAVANNGLWDVQGNVGLFHSSGDVSTFTNSGLLRKSAGSGVASIGNSAGFRFVNSGTLEAAVGTLQYGGASTFQSGTVFAGAGVNQVSGSSTFQGSITSSNLVLSAASSTLQAGEQAVLSGQATWLGSGLVGQWTVGSGATLVAGSTSATGNKVVTGAGSVLANAGTLRLDSATGIGLAAGAALINDGRFEIAVNQGISGGGSFTNNGLLVKSGGTGTSTIGNNAGVAVVNNGTVEVQSGTVQFAGASTFNAGSAFTGAGTAAVIAASTFNGGFSASNLVLSAGISTLQTGNGATLDGQMTWLGSTLAGTWTVGAGSTLIAGSTSATGNKAIGGIGTRLTNAGLVVHDSATGIGLVNGAEIVNQGTWEIRVNQGISHSGGADVRFVNHGLLLKSGGTGASTIGGAAAGFTLVNDGVIDTRSGTLRLTDGFVNAGRLTGDATLQVSGGLANHGTLAPGSAGVGQLALTGGLLTQAADAIFEVDLTSLAAHDLLTVAGTALLDGTLALVCRGCSFAVGDSFTILDASSSLGGSFAALTMTGFASGAFEVVYDLASDSVRLRVTETVAAAVPEPGTYALFGAGLALVGLRIGRRRVL
jgi:hypothetical protein